ncbi:MAG: sigma-70 family RNA polymerase sigma factor [Xanthomonadales bacterium]|nr:sigma-70 family RNA polymerase sigma factor [Xanthomonadales bacterium]MCB1634150.1 sigma-70 family RNA polymerase sigma factor [Xanthomonadales bacterium]MCB1643040.1 sigma-70 family RNA polymerase sigma factor [Xanthomonadales bacterium]
MAGAGGQLTQAAGSRWLRRARGTIALTRAAAMDMANEPTVAAADPASVTAILNDGGASREAMDQVFALVYGELRRLAARVLGQGGGATLNATGLVHEAYAKLISSESLNVSGRQHFYSLCARTMRQIVIDQARSKLSARHGGGLHAITLSDSGLIDLARPESLVALDAALDRLERQDPRLVELLQYRVFAGMELSEIAPLLGVTIRQLQRDWQRARIWITAALDD